MVAANGTSFTMGISDEGNLLLCLDLDDLLQMASSDGQVMVAEEWCGGSGGAGKGQRMTAEK